MSTDTGERSTTPAKPCYSPAVDPHIYLPGGPTCDTPEDWVQLALAALDQGGLSVEGQNYVEQLVRGMMGL